LEQKVNTVDHPDQMLFPFNIAIPTFILESSVTSIRVVIMSQQRAKLIVSIEIWAS
jgi:hypothetical protein